VLFGITLVICLSENASGDASPDASGQVDFAQVKGELAESLKRQLSKADQTQLDYEEEQFDELGQHRLVSKVRYRIRQTPQFHLFEADVITPPPADLKGIGPRSKSQVVARNSRYSFELERPGGQTDWRLKKLHDAKSTEPEPANLTREHLRPGIWCIRPFTNRESIPLTELFDSPTVKLVSCVASPGDAALVRVTYEKNAPPTAPNKPSTKITGWLDLDPAKGWGTRESDETVVYGDTTHTTHCQFDISRDKDGVILLNEIHYEVKLSRAGTPIAHRTQTTKYKTWVEPNVPERDFSLTAYGLPEPPGVTFARPTPTYIWLLVGAASCVVVAVIFRRLARRPTPQPA
jgi:hypothetical protein